MNVFTRQMFVYMNMHNVLFTLYTTEIGTIVLQIYGYSKSHHNRRGITIMKGSSMDPKLKMPTLDIIRCKINDTPHKSSNFKQDKRQEIKEGEN